MALMAPSEWNIAELVSFFAPKVFFALLCGGIVGLERELKNKAAGIKTNMLICLGSSMYTAVSIFIWANLRMENMMGDPARVAAQIVSGIGFLGGGAIIQSRGNVYGMTTAANIWLVAALGICVGVGRADVALVVALLVVSILIGTTYFESRILGRTHSFNCEIVAFSMDDAFRTLLHQTLEDQGLSLEDFDIFPQPDGTSRVKLRYLGDSTSHKGFVVSLWKMTGVKEVRQ